MKETFRLLFNEDTANPVFVRLSDIGSVEFREFVKDKAGYAVLDLKMRSGEWTGIRIKLSTTDNEESALIEAMKVIGFNDDEFEY